MIYARRPPEVAGGRALQTEDRRLLLLDSTHKPVTLQFAVLVSGAPVLGAAKNLQGRIWLFMQCRTTTSSGEIIPHKAPLNDNNTELSFMQKKKVHKYMPKMEEY